MYDRFIIIHLGGFDEAEMFFFSKLRNTSSVLVLHDTLLIALPPALRVEH